MCEHSHTEKTCDHHCYIFSVRKSTQQRLKPHLRSDAHFLMRDTIWDDAHLQLADERMLITWFRTCFSHRSDSRKEIEAQKGCDELLYVSLEQLQEGSKADIWQDRHDDIQGIERFL